MFVSTLLPALALASIGLARPPVVDTTKVRLPYGSFQGVASGNLTSFLGMPFAQPPVGRLRFAPPLPPKPFFAVRNATAYGAACVQQPGQVPSIQSLVKRDTQVESEDCLFINVIKPSVIPKGRRLPVVFYIYGGGFETGDTAENPGDSVVVRSIALGQPVIYVSANYRLNAFGFLPGKEVKAAGLGNVGMRDQRAALEWVNAFIWEFGGDPDKVTIWGESAGAISVGLQMVANNGNTDGLFHGGFMQSGSPIALTDITDGQPVYDQLVANTNCTAARDTLECLRQVPFDDLVAAVQLAPNLFSYQSLQISWKPTVDGLFFPRNPQDSIARGLYARIPIVTGDCDDEGTLFSLSNANVTTDQEFLAYIKRFYLSAATDAELASVAQVYPSDPTQGSPFDTGTANAITPQFKRMASFQGDLIFQAPRRYFLRTAAKTQNAWAFLFKRGKATPYLGSYHSSDIPEFYGTVGASDFIGTDALINFAHKRNPNADAHSGNVSLLAGVNWPKWSSSASAPPLLTLLDPAPAVTLTTDTYRVDAMNLLIDLTRKYQA